MPMYASPRSFPRCNPLPMMTVDRRRFSATPSAVQRPSLPFPPSHSLSLTSAGSKAGSGLSGGRGAWSRCVACPRSDRRRGTEVGKEKQKETPSAATSRFFIIFSFRPATREGVCQRQRNVLTGALPNVLKPPPPPPPTPTPLPPPSRIPRSFFFVVVEKNQWTPPSSLPFPARSPTGPAAAPARPTSQTWPESPASVRAY